MGIGKCKSQIFHFILEAARKRILSWKNGFLSQAGKDVLIKSVVMALPVYAMSCFRIPNTILDEISRMISRFWWNADEDHRKIHWVGWQEMTKTMEKGGLGFKEFRAFNNALLAKQLWRVETAPTQLISRVMRAKYFPNTGILMAQPKQHSSWTWKSWVSARYIMEKGLRFQVGDGHSINLWEHNWLPEQPLKIVSSRSNHSTLTLARDLMDVDGKKWNQTPVRQLFSPLEAEVILRIPISQFGAKDRPVWHFTTHGFYTVNSGYQLAIRIQNDRRGGAGPSGLVSAEGRKWKVLWEMRIKAKIKLFLWKCNHRALPVKVELKHRKMPIDPICLFCGEHEETLENIFFNAEGLREFGLLHQCRLQLTAYLLWHMWKSRLETIRWVLSEAHQFNWDKLLLYLDDKVMAKTLNDRASISKETKAITDDIFLLGSFSSSVNLGVIPIVRLGRK